MKCRVHRETLLRIVSSIFKKEDNDISTVGVGSSMNAVFVPNLIALNKI